jgi:SAM-dependent methyltransferase
MDVVFPLREVFSLEELADQYREQALWSASVVGHFWPRGIPEAVLDVGCGPSPGHLLNMPGVHKTGVDIDGDTLDMLPPGITGVRAPSEALPFPDGTFDVVMCHYLLLWAPMRSTLAEMRRVLAPGGRLICASEPDYTGREEEPDCLTPLFLEAMERLGARADAGARLEEELVRLIGMLEDGSARPAGRVECGVLEMSHDTAYLASQARADAHYLSRVLGRDCVKLAEPLVEALRKGEGRLVMPVHYGCLWG